MSIKSKLKLIIKELKEESTIHPKEEKEQIPTFEKGIYKKFSPMLKERFDILGAWEDSTHGDWLSLSEMENLWDENITDDRLRDIKINLISNQNNWDNDALSLFKNNRISVFAASAYTNERVFIVWLDAVIEPELWVYDTNGFSMFQNLEKYFDAYIDDEVVTTEFPLEHLNT